MDEIHGIIIAIEWHVYRRADSSVEFFAQKATPRDCCGCTQGCAGAPNTTFFSFRSMPIRPPVSGSVAIPCPVKGAG